MTDQEYLDACRAAGFRISDADLLAMRSRHQAAQEREEAQKKVPCGYCTQLVPSVFVWTQVPSADDLYEEADGKFFHTDCYGVYLIQKGTR
jgi:hypothetical protein